MSERIHALIYRDATSSWGHRHAVLHTFTNDWGASNTEGFIGVGVSEGSNYQNCLWGCMNFPFAQILTIDYYDPQGGAIGFSFKGLPIELLAFSAEKVNDVVHLSWSTASEINSDYFIIEKSIDGYHFEELELIDAAGVSNSVINYSGVDKNIVFGKNYYRLKQVDLDGTFLYSDVVNVEFDREDSVLVSPNPFKNKLLIEGYFFSNYNELTLMNLKGEIIYSSSINKGEQKVEINIPNLKNGVYFIQIKNNKKQNIYKVIKI